MSKQKQHYPELKAKEAHGCALLKEFMTEYGARLNTSRARPKMDTRSRVLTYFERWRTTQLSPGPKDRYLVVKQSAQVADLSVGMSAVVQNRVSDILAYLAHLARTLQQGADDGTSLLLKDPRASAEMRYHMWLGASMVMSISHSDAPLNSAMYATKALIPDP